MAIYVWRTEGRRRALEGIGAFVLAAVLVIGPFAALAFGGVGFSLRTQLERHLQFESLGASVLLALSNLGVRHADYVYHAPNSVDLSGGLAESVGVLTTLLQAAAIVSVAVVSMRGRQSPERLVAASAAAVGAFVAFGKVLSPQYVIWLLPLVVILDAVRARIALAALLVALGLSQIEFAYGDQLKVGAWPVWCLLPRNLLLVGVFGLLLLQTVDSGGRHRARPQARHEHRSRCPGRPSRLDRRGRGRGDHLDADEARGPN